MTEATVNFLLQCARYFRKRSTGGEDKQHWANVTNAENCEKAASLIRQLRDERDGLSVCIGKIAETVPLPEVIRATGTLGDMVEYFRDLHKRAESAEAEVSSLRKRVEALQRERDAWKSECEYHERQRFGTAPTVKGGGDADHG